MGLRGSAVEKERISRTQKKKADRALQKLGERLMTLSDDQLESCGLPDELVEAVRLAGCIKAHGARRRQLQTIGALMRRIDPEPVRLALQRLRATDFRQTGTFWKIEKWRDAIVAGEEGIIDEILDSCPAAERQRLYQLAGNARKAGGTPMGKKASRMLFRYLMSIHQ